MREGLYVTLGPKGTIKKHLSTRFGEVPLKETTIAEELIRFSERNFAYLSTVILALYEMLENIYYKPDAYTDYENYMERILAEMESADVFCWTLARTMLADLDQEAILNDWNTLNRVKKVIAKLSAVLSAQETVSFVLDQLCELLPIEHQFILAELHQVSVTKIFTLETELTEQYLFRSEEDYYLFLLQHFIVSKPNIAKCHFCNRYFLPKTRKQTLYCDRMMKNGKTCKQIAPRLKRKELAAADRVIGEFDRSKEMMYRRAERTGPDKKPSPIDLTRPAYWAWLTKATDALDSYLIGELSEEEAIQIIHVPTIQEIRENQAEDCTLVSSVSK